MTADGAASPRASRIDAAAAAFVEARGQWRAMPNYPGRHPADLAAAYRIQDSAIALAGREVVGWKLGRIGVPGYAVARLAGPIFAGSVAVARPGDAAPAMPVFAEGFAAVEAEFVLRVGETVRPSPRSYAIADARAIVEAVHVGLEIASSPFPGINDHGPEVTVSDFGNNNGLVLGAAIAHWQDAALDDWPVELRIDDRVVGSGSTATMLDGPFGSLRFLLEHLAARGRALTAGSLVSTGAITGVHRIAPGQRATASFGADLAVHCRIEAGRV